MMTINGNVSQFASLSAFPPYGAIELNGGNLSIGASGSLYAYNMLAVYSSGLGATLSNYGTIVGHVAGEALSIDNHGTIRGAVRSYGSVLVSNSGFIESVESAGNGAGDIAVTNTGTISNMFVGAGTTFYNGEAGHLSGSARVSGGNLEFQGGAGSERIEITVGTCTVDFGSGNDILTVRNGFGSVEGGAGVDEVRYIGSGACTIDLSGGGLLADGGAHYFLSGFENAVGNFANNTLVGSAADNVLNGGSGGIDTMTGGLGNDIYVVDNLGDSTIEAANQGLDIVRASATYILAAGRSIEYLTTTQTSGTTAMNLAGNELSQGIIGNNGANVLSGNAGDDMLSGVGGADGLNGGLGNDRLFGGAGADAFIFNTALNATTNVDTIGDFVVVDDIMRLENTGAGLFNTLANGTLAGTALVIGAAATSAAHRIVYNSTTGALSYDADGVGAGAAIKFAQLSTGLALTNADFQII